MVLELSAPYSYSLLECTYIPLLRTEETGDGPRGPSFSLFARQAIRLKVPCGQRALYQNESGLLTSGGINVACKFAHPRLPSRAYMQKNPVFVTLPLRVDPADRFNYFHSINPEIATRVDL